ncbi:DUF4365 domain-containing protein [Vibrio vulnificus]|uniref:DUF4365 domain-containing protein n=1 Tax=Vibrio vulnificus TaxID=672 RepID=UPI000D3E96A5|nr:DUF4365 domain-containing protein [Vibrio vulnificus]EHU0328781.1 DUF4365 domain-containing protein [Vibrio vulnificus]EJN6716981.1 DUF4365 domain-containing protein [Vibrio vulnificus]MBN8108620.1 DUF4365 domain-containing protein [Vibrio vulnificus]MCU8175839.1 DUF4365 domain-containing protein [Vibrio vulnificus]MDS1843057.1 DUF4365 domain-containing protein [Vibrio vulnificus]
MNCARGKGGTAVSHSKELVSLSYMYALCASTGLNISDPIIDNDGIDVTFRGKGYHGFAWTKPKLDAQLKCTTFKRSNIDFKKGVLSFKLYKNNYDELTDLSYPSILIINTVPSLQEKWVQQNNHSINLRYSCYWYSLMGEKKLAKGSRILKVPLTQKLTPAALLWLMEQTASKKIISNNGGVYA